MTGDDQPGVDVSRRLLQALAAGDVSGVRALFAGPADIDDPFAGRQVDGGFESLVTGWGPARSAVVRGVELTLATSAEGCCAAEIALHLERAGRSFILPIVLVSEMPGGRVRRARLYYRRAVLDGRQHYRDRLLEEREDGVRFRPVVVTFQQALARGDVEAMVATFSADAYVDGHGQAQGPTAGLGMGRYEGRAAIHDALAQQFGILTHEAGSGQAGVRLELVNAFSDGTTTVIEYNLIHRRHPTNRVQAGAACYELDADGWLKAARVYDEAW